MGEDDQRTEAEQAVDPNAVVEEGQAEHVDSAEGDEAQPSVEELREALTAAEAKAAANYDAMLRANAEMENIKRRAQRDVENAHKYALEKFANELLGVADTLEMGLSAAKEEGADLAKLIEGKELTAKMLFQVFDKFGIKPVDAVGEKFNPEKHEAMAMQPSSEHEPNTVINVVQKGYTLNDRLIRPAMVIVARAG